MQYFLIFDLLNRWKTYPKNLVHKIQALYIFFSIFKYIIIIIYYIFILLFLII